MFRTKLLEEEKDDLDLALFFIYYFLLVVSLIMSMVSEKIVGQENEKKSDLVIFMIYYKKMKFIHIISLFQSSSNRIQRMTLLYYLELHFGGLTR